VNVQCDSADSVLPAYRVRIDCQGPERVRCQPELPGAEARISARDILTTADGV
jgi:hypothetical protein